MAHDSAAAAANGAVKDSQTTPGSTIDRSNSASSVNEDGVGIKASDPEKGLSSAPEDAATAPGDSDDGAPAPAQSGDGPPVRTKVETYLIMASLCSALFLAALDTTIITTAVPTIAEEFQSPAGYTWVGSAFLLGNAATVPSWGKISDIWGRKPVMLAAVAVFWIGSILCGFSINMGMLIGSRAVQGVGGGGIVVLVNICIADLFSPRERGIYYGVIGFVWALASAIGPVIGGAFTTRATWRWCFWLNLPICGVAFAVLIFVLRLHNPKTPMREGLMAVDWLGSILAVGGTLMFLFGLEFGGITFPWGSAATVCLIVFGVVTIGLFLVVEARVAKYPVIPLRLFRNRARVIAYSVCFCHAIVFMSASYWLPLYYQGVIGVSSLLSGVYLLPYVLSMSILSALTGIYIRKSGNYQRAIVFGMTLMAVGFGLLIDLGPTLNVAKMVVYQIVAGVGVGPNFQSPLIAIQNTVEARDLASATSTFAFIRQLSTAISVVIGGVVFQNSMQNQYPYLLSELGPELANQLSGGSAAGSVTVVAALQGHEGEVAKMAYWLSLRNMFIMYTAFAGVGVFLAPWVGQKKLSEEHTEHKTGLKSLQREVSRTAEGLKKLGSRQK